MRVLLFVCVLLGVYTYKFTSSYSMFSISFYFYFFHRVFNITCVVYQVCGLLPAAATILKLSTFPSPCQVMSTQIALNSLSTNNIKMYIFFSMSLVDIWETTFVIVSILRNGFKICAHLIWPNGAIDLPVCAVECAPVYMPTSRARYLYLSTKLGNTQLSRICPCYKSEVMAIFFFLF